jgi:hypothetical protein
MRLRALPPGRASRRQARPCTDLHLAPDYISWDLDVLAADHHEAVDGHHFRTLSFIMRDTHRKLIAKLVCTSRVWRTDRFYRAVDRIIRPFERGHLTGWH